MVQMVRWWDFELYLDYYEMVENELIRIVEESITLEKVLVALNAAFLALILKMIQIPLKIINPFHYVTVYKIFLTVTVIYEQKVAAKLVGMKIQKLDSLV